ncbi:9644_t:CDS:2, partial [Dentiscutata erythropus]
EMVNNEELTKEQQDKAKEFLLTEEKLFALSIEDMGNKAVKRVEKAQENAKRRYDQNLLPIEEFKKGDQVLVYKAFQQYSKSHKLHPK